MFGFGEGYNEKQLGEYGTAMRGRMLPALQQLLSGIGQQSYMPELSAEDYARLQAQYARSMQMGQHMLGKQYQQSLSDVQTGAVSKGLRGSSAHGRATGQAQSGYMTGLQQLHTSSADQMQQQALAMRQAMMNDMLQRYGIQSGLVGQGMGLPVQAFGAAGGLEMERNKGLMSALSGIGGSFPGIGSGIYNWANPEDTGSQWV